MTRTVSISQCNKLGEKLRKSDEPSEADLRLLQEVLADHAEPMAEIQSVLSSLGLQSTARLKTSGTIIDKLKRDATRLSKMQDLAGARVVKDMGLGTQNRIVARIVKALPGAAENDLRRKPRSGYRAVHVIVPIDNCTVEIQVRTEMQDLWANLVESFEGDMGRDIRYGGKPMNPRERVFGIVSTETNRRPTQTQMLRALLNLSRLVGALEEQKELARGMSPRERAHLKKGIAETEKKVKSLFKGVIEARRRRAT